MLFPNSKFWSNTGGANYFRWPAPVIIGCILFLGATLGAQSYRESGIPFHTSFNKYDYSGHDQNWAIDQDEKGIMYFGNNLGVLEYDGTSWRLIPIPSIVRSLTVNRANQICIGAQGDFGYLRPDSSGRQSFVSLLDQLEEEDRAFTNVWKTFATAEGTYFNALSHLFRWTPEGVRVWRPERSFGWAFPVRDELYILELGKGIMRLAGDSLQLLPGTADYAQERIYFILPYGSNQLLIGTRTRGLELYDDGTLRSFSTEADDYLKQKAIYHAAFLPDGNLAICTLEGGLVIIDDAGRLVQIMDTRVLPDNKVHYVFSRDRGEIWLALDDGITHLNYPAAVTCFGPESGMPGDVESIVEHQGRLYAATSSGGLFYFLPGQLTGGDFQFPEFRPVPGITGSESCHALLSVGDHLLLGTSRNVYEVSERGVSPVTGEPHSPLYFLRSKFDTLRVYAGGNGELFSLHLSEDGWLEEGSVLGIDLEEVRPIVETTTGDLWLGTRNHGTLRVRMGGDFRVDPLIERYYTDHGLPEGDTYVFTVGDTVLFATDQGLYRFDETRSVFVPDSSQGPAVAGGGLEVFRLKEDEQGNVWLVTPAFAGVNRRNPGGGYTLDTLPFVQIPKSSLYALYPASAGRVWIGGNPGVYHYDPTGEGNYTADFSVLIRQIKVNDDSLLFGGYHGQASGSSRFQQPGDYWPELDFNENELRFEFAATSFFDPGANRYQYWLEGFDKTWSGWTAETRKSYTNIPPGTYQFRVRAKDLYGNQSAEDVFSFTILPPWYRTWWALLLASLLIAGAISGIVAAYVRFKTKKQAMQLAKEQLLNRRLQQLDNLKDQFLANTSHELRTPLHGIIGIAESIVDDLQSKTEEELRQNVGMIITSGRRLSSLVNDLLDFSRAKNRDLQLQPKSLDLAAVVEVVLHSCRPLAAPSGLELRNEIPADLPLVLADENRLQQILFNLVGNAIKFTRKGFVSVGAGANGDQVTVVVRDTGIGIPREKQASIFNYFEQGEGSTTRRFGGTGLGLAITSELVELHQGRLWVESEPEKGSSFFFTLPQSKEPTRLKDARSKPMAAAPPVFARDLKLPIPLTSPAADRVKILIVDDEPINHQVLRNYLAGEQYLITSIMSGDEAIETIELGVRFDLVLLDVMMPKVSGYDVCQAIREQYLPSELPVIMVTAKNQIQDLVQGLNTGANDYLAKPFRKEEFLARVKTQLDLHLINEMTSKFVPNEFLRSLGHKRITEVRLGDQTERDVTVVFSDIRDYTSLAESMKPEENFKFVNAFNGRMGPVIREHFGFINQYLGDAIMAIFPNNPGDGLRAAIKMQEALKKYNDERIARNRDPVKIGLGLHTGPLIMGIIGDEKRLEATTIADTVNVASRIENLTKYYGTSILLSEQCLEKIPDQDEFHFRYLGQVQVKGKKTPVGIYECFDGDPLPSLEKKLKTQSDFEKGLSCFFAKDFPEASAIFNQILKINPEDSVAQLFLNKSSRYTYEGVPEGWTGVEVMVFK